MSDFNPGDVVEIETDKGLAYAQITHNHPSYPPVVRVIAGLHETRPDSIGALVDGETLFVAMIPLDGAMKQAGRRCELVGRVAIPKDQRAFPTFRMPIRDKKGEIVYWWFWDGRGLSYDTALTADQQKLPMREVITGRRFLERVLEGSA